MHTAAQTYRQTGTDFFPGPLDTLNASTDSSKSLSYDKIWKISRYEIDEFKYHFANGDVQNGSYTPSTDFIFWPTTENGNYARKLAPFVDANQNGVYDPLIGGDFPKIKGDQMLFSIFNDTLGSHGESGGKPLQIEVHASAYAYNCNEIDDNDSLSVINYTTFYNYKIFNRSNNNYDSVYVGSNTDFDLGSASDDAIATYSKGNFVYARNFDNNDFGGYGNKIPLISKLILNGPKAKTNDGLDNDNDGFVDEANEKCLLNKSISYNNSNLILGNPTLLSKGADYYNYLKGCWKDSTQLTRGGNGYGGNTPANFVYDGFPYDLTSWNVSNGNDYRIVSSSGPTTFLSNENIETEYAFVFTPADNVIWNSPEYFNNMIRDNRIIKRMYDNQTFPSCLQINQTILSKINNNTIQLFPNPANNFITLKLTEFIPNISITIYNSLGTEIKYFSNEYFTNTYNNLEINISNLSNGIYFVKVANENVLLSKTFIKN